MAASAKFGSFQQRANTGTQVITGVGFRPTGLVIFGNYVGASAAGSGANTWRTGLSDGTHNVSYTVNSGNFSNAVEVCESAFAQTKCFLGVATAAGPFSTPAITTYGYIVSFDADGFTVNFEYNLNNQQANATWFYLALGGDIQTYVGTVSTHGTGTATVTGIPFAPTGLIGWNTTDQVGPSNGSQGEPRYGWAALCDSQQCSISGVMGTSVAISTDASIQINGKWTSAINTSGTLTAECVLTGFTSDGFSVSFASFGVTAQYYMAIGGCAMNLGSFTQPASTGTQSVAIAASSPRAVLIVGRNKVTSTVGGPDFLATIGGTDGTTQGSAWTGTLNGQAAPYKCMETVDFTHAITAYTPTGDFAATVNTVGAVTGLTNGNVALNWTTVDGVQREWYYLVFADDFGTGACGTHVASTTYPIRRERIFLLPSEQDYRMFLSQLEILVQSGVGLVSGQGSDPTFSLEISRDGGKTYGTAYVLTPGMLGDYAHRSFVSRLGYYRQGAVRLAMSDPVLWAIVDGWAEVEKGLN